MTQHNLNDPNQHSFRPKHSIEKVLNITTLNDGLIAQLRLLDLSNTFDTISHEIIFFRLNYVGINCNSYDSIKSYAKAMLNL